MNPDLEGKRERRDDPSALLGTKRQTRPRTDRTRSSVQKRRPACCTRARSEMRLPETPLIAAPGSPQWTGTAQNRCLLLRRLLLRRLLLLLLGRFRKLTAVLLSKKTRLVSVLHSMAHKLRVLHPSKNTQPRVHFSSEDRIRTWNYTQWLRTSNDGTITSYKVAHLFQTTLHLQHARCLCPVLTPFQLEIGLVFVKFTTFLITEKCPKMEQMCSNLGDSS